MKKNRWLCKKEFILEIKDVSEKLKVEIGTIQFRDMKNKWASIREDGSRLTINKELLDLDKSIGRYVIVHELCHINISNHGKLFKSIISLYVPDYKKIESQLRKISGTGQNNDHN
jgi:hypothetical protein